MLFTHIKSAIDITIVIEVGGEMIVAEKSIYDDIYNRRLNLFLLCSLYTPVFDIYQGLGKGRGKGKRSTV